MPGLGDLRVSQAAIVAALSLVLFASFAVFLDGFLTFDNIVNLLRNVAVLGMLGIGMAAVVIGRGIDLSIVPIMVVTVAALFVMAGAGVPVPLALGLAVVLALAFGAANGVLIAYLEIPSLFTTLAWGMVALGLGNYLVFDNFLVTMPAELSGLRWLGTGQLAGVPVSIFLFFALAVVVHLLLVRTHAGRSVFAIGDNVLAARNAGVPIRPVIVAKYAGVALLAFFAGLIMASAVNEMNSRIPYSTLPYDVILVVVIGGIGLSGGRGGIHNVVVGTLLIGNLSNGMTIMNLAHTDQKIVQALILLIAIVVDGLLNPRDEQVSQQGDI